MYVWISSSFLMHEARPSAYNAKMVLQLFIYQMIINYALFFAILFLIRLRVTSVISR
jgi:hypothetical protein